MAVERKLSPTHEAPYRGLRVLDFGQGIASPYCAMLLAVYGADSSRLSRRRGIGRVFSERRMKPYRCRQSITAASGRPGVLATDAGYC
jgi:crotonobetainyl-CoA:carnitine CoA-transferase CaiB-like acyl-CoA transferase